MKETFSERASEDPVRQRYIAVMGREPVERVPEGHPDRWQWDYTGRTDERERLRELLGLTDETPPQTETLL